MSSLSKGTASYHLNIFSTPSGHNKFLPSEDNKSRAQMAVMGVECTQFVLQYNHCGMSPTQEGLIVRPSVT